jgi:hypothetical protein
VLRLLVSLAVVVLLTALTQVGGAILLGVIATGRIFRWGRFAVAGGFLVAYAAASLIVVPPLAALGGRVPLSCTSEPLRALPVLCALNRHYIRPGLLTLANTLAADVDAEFPGSVTVALDANFPFLDDFPLLPHLSHDDGRKLDLAFYYSGADGSYLPAVTRSPIGYWAFEKPAATEETTCPDALLSARWDMPLLQPLFPSLKLEPKRTRYALDWLFEKGPAHGLQRVFLEPYLAHRLGVSSELLGFQGCRAARHDDHIHLQVH